MPLPPFMQNIKNIPINTIHLQFPAKINMIGSVKHQQDLFLFRLIKIIRADYQLINLFLRGSFHNKVLRPQNTLVYDL